MTYPPGRKECLLLFEELKQLDSTSGFEFMPRKYEIIHDLAEAQYHDARAHFVSGLDSPDPDYRWGCISALITHWKDRDQYVVSKLIEMAKHDSDVQVRMIAISSLGVLQIKSAKRLLRRIVESGEDADVVKAAQDALSKI